MARNSLNFRLWITILIAVIPLLAFVLFDHQERREQAIADIEATVNSRLADVSHQAQSARKAVESILRIIAQSDDLHDLGAGECSGIARRMLGSLEDFANIGAALPDGTVFCSARPMAGPLNVADRAWFARALEGRGLSPGEFGRGLVSGEPRILFGYPVTAPAGDVRAVLFASIRLDWLYRVFESFRLPAGWEVGVISVDGHVQVHYPKRMPWGEPQAPAALLAALPAVAETGAGVLQAQGSDGEQRFYGVLGPGHALSSNFLVVGAPLERSMNAVDRRMQFSLVVIAAIALLSALLARVYVYRLIEVWAEFVRGVVARIAAGRLDARIGRRVGIGELDELARGIDHMAAEIEQRNTKLRQLSMVIEQSPESIIITDPAPRILYVNDAFLATTGYSPEEVLGHNPSMLNKGLTPKETYAEMWSCLGRGEVWRGEFHNTRKDGSTYLELATIAPIKDEAGVVTHFVAVKEDITERKQSEALLHRLAYYDALTELPNRALLHDRIAQAIRSSGRSETYGLLMLLDIDRFQSLNDTLGHAAGDRLLRAVAARLRASVREDDTVARHGDDDFAILVSYVGDSGEEALAHAEQIVRQVQGALQQPYRLGDTERDVHYVTLSCGISLFYDRESTLESLLKQAEVALYRAKQDGRGNVRFFSPDMQAVADARMRMEAGLHEAIEAGSLRVFYQPQVDRDGRLVGAEALVRWPLADGSMVSPAEFIPLAEDTGLIVPLGLWVLRTACAQLARWQADERTRHLTIAVNVSPRQFHQADFGAGVKQMVSAAGVDPSLLKLELTESAILNNLDDTVVRMNQLRESGIRFALDDFGTGYSSLSYLKRLPFAQLKIDQSFVRDMAEDEGSAAIVLAILSMGKALGLEIVAEGVETPAQREFLRRNGCAFYQGYLFGKPMPIEAWGDVLAEA